MNDGLIKKAQNYENEIIILKAPNGEEVIGVCIHQSDISFKLKEVKSLNMSARHLKEFGIFAEKDEITDYSTSFKNDLVEFNRSQIESYGLANEEYQEKYKAHTQKE